VLLTPAGKSVVFADGPVRFLLPPEGTRSQRGSRSRAPRRRDRGAETNLDPAAAALFEALRVRRLALAREGGVPPYVVASDRTLRELAEIRPTSVAGLENIFGIGPAKAAKYGAQLLDALRGATA
jgi:ATP-dependent DNA helicase RecQ